MMSLVLCLLSLSVSVSTATNAGLFDIAEYRRVSYEATIGNDLLWFIPGVDVTKVSANNIDALEQRILSKIPKETEPNYMFVTSTGGQKFACSLPNVDGLTTTTVPRSSKNPKIYGDALAASFYVDKCIKLRGNNWWSYTLCRGQTVEQTHGEEGTEGYVKNILGIFDGNYAMPPYHESTDDRLLYVEESYASGTFCDLAEYREPRRTAVRYECDAQLSTNEAYVQSVVEVRPCQYLMTVKVGTLCHFPEFLPVSQANTQNIGCQPYMTQEQVRYLLEQAIEERTRRENLELEAKLSRHKYRMATERYTAMVKGQRKLHVPDVAKRVNAEMDYRAAHFNLMIYNMKVAGETVTKKKEDSVWKLLKTADISDYLLYVDYDSITDENRGHLWYYFNDPTWPKNQFPKDIYSIAVQNGYMEELQENLEGEYTFQAEEGGYLDELKKFIATGVMDLKYNLVISAMDIYHDIAEHKMQALEGKKYNWLYYLYGTFLANEDNTVEKIVNSLTSLKEFIMLPLSNHSISAAYDMFSEVDKDLKVIAKYGDAHEEKKRTRSPRRKFIYDTIVAKAASPELQAKGYDYQLSIVNETLTERHLTRLYEAHLAPIYQLLSIQWFQQVYSPGYFHIHPPSDEHLWDPENDDWKYHMMMAQDMTLFIRMLAAGTLMKMKYFIDVQAGKKEGDFSPQSFVKNWAKIGKLLNEKETKLEFDELVKDTFYNAFDHYGPMAVNSARERLWKKKVERWRMNYWIKDYKLRKESKALHNLMSDLLAMNGKDVISSVGGASKKKKDEFEGDALKKVKAMLDLSNDELDDLLMMEDDSMSDSLRLALEDEQFMGWDEMKEVIDLLSKAGLSKDADVQIKVFDANGNELSDNDLEAVAKNLLDEVDSVAKFRDLEKAYSAKPSWNSEKEEKKTGGK